jgi:hypothetical protein
MRVSACCRGVEHLPEAEASGKPGSRGSPVHPEVFGGALRQGGPVLSPPPWVTVLPKGAVRTHAPYPHRQLWNALGSATGPESG